jgi:hypothetical protein
MKMKKASTRLASPYNHLPLCLPNPQVKHIHHNKSSAIEQNDVPANHDMLAAGRWRRKVPLQVSGTDHNPRS